MVVDKVGVGGLVVRLSRTLFLFLPLHVIMMRRNTILSPEVFLFIRSQPP